MVHEKKYALNHFTAVKYQNIRARLHSFTRKDDLNAKHLLRHGVPLIFEARGDNLISLANIYSASALILSPKKNFYFRSEIFRIRLLSLKSFQV